MTTIRIRLSQRVAGEGCTRIDEMTLMLSCSISRVQIYCQFQPKPCKEVITWSCQTPARDLRKKISKACRKRNWTPGHSGRDFSAHGSYGRLSGAIEMYFWLTPATYMALLECFEHSQEEETAQLAPIHTHQRAPRGRLYGNGGCSLEAVDCGVNLSWYRLSRMNSERRLDHCSLRDLGKGAVPERMASRI